MTTEDILAKASIEEIKKYNKDKYLYDGIEADFASVYYRTKRNYVGNHPQDIQSEILTDAWLYVFKKNGNKNIKSFVGFNPSTGTQITYPQYFSLLMRNAVINESKAKKKFYDNEYTPYTDSTSEEGIQTLDDYIDYHSNTPKTSKAYRVDDEYIESLKAHIQDLADLLDTIQRNRKQVKNKERAIKKIRAEMDKLNHEIQSELGEFTVKLIDTEAYNEQYQSSSAEDMAQSNETLLDIICNITESIWDIESFSDPDMFNETLLTLLGLLAGLNRNDMAEFLKCNNQRISYCIEIIQKHIKKYGEEQDFEDGNAYYTRLIQTLDTGKNMPQLSREEAKPLNVIRKALKTQLYAVLFNLNNEGNINSILKHSLYNVKREYFPGADNTLAQKLGEPIDDEI